MIRIKLERDIVCKYLSEEHRCTHWGSYAIPSVGACRSCPYYKMKAPLHIRIKKRIQSIKFK